MQGRPKRTLTAAGGGASAALAQAHARLLADRRYQFDFAVYTPPRTPDWLIWLSKVLRPLAPFMPYLFWGTLALGVGFLLFLVGREMLRQRGGVRGRAKVLDQGFAPSRARVLALLAEADRLAGEGRFGEAVRVLLLRTLDDIEARRPGLIGPAQTAREIAALDAIPLAARQPLARIAAAVERFLFAGRPLDAEAFQGCRADYDRFLQAASAG